MTDFEKCLIAINKNILLDNYKNPESNNETIRFLIDDIINLQELAVTNIEKYRYIDFIASLPDDVDFMISRYAFELYRNKEFDIACYAFLKATQKERQKNEDSSVNNLVYMLRRNEGNIASGFSVSDMTKLLNSGFENHEPYSIVNLALLFVQKSGEDVDWKISSEIIKELRKSNDSLNDMVAWWSNVENVGYTECLVVHLLLIRNEIIEKSEFGTKSEIIDKLASENVIIPEWI